jgi:NAD(P)-dependent dehydrogenase (short-subunit alcohol dehydrogenase family)
MTDVTSEADIRQSLRIIIATFGKINVAVNCAGIPNPGKIKDSPKH